MHRVALSSAGGTRLPCRRDLACAEPYLRGLVLYLIAGAAAGELLQPGTYEVGVCSAALVAATTQTYFISGDVQAVVTQ